MSIEELRLKFLELQLCKLCGSQRCDRSLEWLEGCPFWEEFCKENEN